MNTDSVQVMCASKICSSSRLVKVRLQAGSLLNLVLSNNYSICVEIQTQFDVLDHIIGRSFVF